MEFAPPPFNLPVMENNPESKKIEIGQETLNYLNSAGRWAMFLAISGFIFLGLIIVIGLIAGTFLSAFSNSDIIPGIPELFLILIFFAISAICFFPVFFLFRFSKYTSNALATQNKEELHKAFKNLKFYFVYLGLLLIIVLSFYIIALIVAGTSMPFLKGPG